MHCPPLFFMDINFYCIIAWFWRNTKFYFTVVHKHCPQLHITSTFFKVWSKTKVLENVHDACSCSGVTRCKLQPLSNFVSVLVLVMTFNVFMIPATYIHQLVNGFTLVLSVTEIMNSQIWLASTWVLFVSFRLFKSTRDAVFNTNTCSQKGRQFNTNRPISSGFYVQLI